MERFTIILTLVAFTRGASVLDTVKPEITNRIVGGMDAMEGEAPYMVSVRLFNKHTCGGSILSPSFVLTAAHCVYRREPSLFSVQYGVLLISDDGPNVINVSHALVHEDYVAENEYPNDIAVLKLSSDMNFGSYVKPVRLPTPFQTPRDDSQALLAGWGLNRSGGTVTVQLQVVNITVFSETYCAEHDRLYNPDIHYCAGDVNGGKGQCMGDSGGPLVIDGIQYGIVSWSQKPCGSAGHPGYYTRVPTYRDWIFLHTRI